MSIPKRFESDFNLFGQSFSNYTEHDSSCVEVKSSWPGGYDANLLFKSTVEVDHWNAQVIFNARFDKIDIFNGADVQCSGSMCTFSDLGW